MNASIDELGTLHVQAETPLESYALRKWADENFSSDGSMHKWATGSLVVNLGVQTNKASQGVADA